MKRLVFLILLVSLEPEPASAQTKAIPRTDLVVPVRAGSTHAAIVWIDSGGVLHKEKITQAAYAAIPAAGAPPRPSTFTGTAVEWVRTWTGPGTQADPRKAWAVGGRPTLTTSSGEPELGTVERDPVTGRVLVYTGEDIDAGLAPTLGLAATEYVGVFPVISTVAAKCGLTIIAGQIQPGNLNVACSRIPVR